MTSFNIYSQTGWRWQVILEINGVLLHGGMEEGVVIRICNLHSVTCGFKSQKTQWWGQKEYPILMPPPPELSVNAGAIS